MIIFVMFFVLFLSLLVLLSNNMIIWWSVFLMMTLLFIMMNKSLVNYNGIFNYFIIQEVLGLLFLVYFNSFIQFFMILMKVGVSPLHFWVFSIMNNVYDFNVMWFLTFQKLPYLFILLQIIWLSFLFLFIIGLFVCYFQMFLMKSYKNLIIISSTESFSWILLNIFFSFMNTYYLFIYYFLLMVMLISKFNKFNMNFLNLETTLIFMNMPFTVSFFIKIFSLSNIFKIETYLLLFLLFLMFLSLLSFSFWMINLSCKSKIWLQNNNKFLYFFIFPLMYVVII